MRGTIFGRVFSVGCVLGGLAALIAPAPAQERPDCADVTTQTQAVICYGQLMSEAETAMNRKLVMVKSLRRFLEDSELDAGLDEAQLAFLRYRKQTCDGVFAFRAGGSNQYPESLACQLLLDRQRAAALDNLYRNTAP
jgi:uncharacterized protein YecT (DUF1311 family)